MKLINNNKWSASLIVVAVLTFTVLMLLLYVDFNPTQWDIDTLKIRKAYIWADLWIDEGIHIFKNKVEDFYWTLNWCKRVNGWVPIIYSADSKTNNWDFWSLDVWFNYDWINLQDNSFVNGRGYLNRTCSIYSDTYPYSWNEDFAIDIADLTIPNFIPNNETYFIKMMDREENKWFIFSKDTLLDENGMVITEDRPKFKVAFNILTATEMEKFWGFDYLQWSPKYKNIVNLLKSRWIEVNKENIMNYFSKDLANISNEAKIEIGLVEYTWNFSSAQKWYEVDTSAKPKVIKRLICEHIVGSVDPDICELDMNGIDTLKAWKVYFFYYKTFDKATTVSFQIHDSAGSKINFITWDLKIEAFWNDDKTLIKKTYVKENIINADLSSAIFNYLYYSQN